MAATANSGAVEPSRDNMGQPDLPDAVAGESAVQNAVAEGKATMGEVEEAWGEATHMARMGHSKEEIEAELNQGMDLQGAVITVVVAGATAFVGINVMSSIGDSMNLESGDMFYNASEALQEGIQGFFTNLPTVFVVIALVLVISYLTILR